MKISLATGYYLEKNDEFTLKIIKEYINDIFEQTTEEHVKWRFIDKYRDMLIEAIPDYLISTNKFAYFVFDRQNRTFKLVSSKDKKLSEYVKLNVDDGILIQNLYDMIRFGEFNAKELCERFHGVFYDISYNHSMKY